ncbi:MAG: L-lactate dehydrogenase [Firmicutes bacterium]|nr:L-lactate dehydrogenase [Bacillota bacterium]
MAKVVLVGCGNVGMSYAFAMVTSRNKVSELVLIDIDSAKADGEAQDLLHASAYNTNRVRVRAGGYSECKDADVVCICAGAAQAKGETRRDLVRKNAAIMRSIVTEVQKSGFGGIYLVATNPVDVMTQVVWKISGMPHGRVIGSGTTLDTARLRQMIGAELDLHPANVHSYVLGEHGDSSFVPWSSSVIGLTPIDRFLTPDQKARILYHMRTSAYDIINKKGSTYYGIGICLKDITDAILEDANAIKTVSVYCAKDDLYYGMPAVIGRNGVLARLELPLNQEECERKRKTTEVLEDMWKAVGL